MRGRTNIPPRLGGIVNGVVTECTVVEESGISIGDYVQAIQKTGLVNPNILLALNQKVYGPFELPDGKVVVFLYDSESNVLYANMYVITDNGYEDSNEQVELLLHFDVSESNAFMLIEKVADAKFCLAYSNKCYIIEYNKTWSIEQGNLEGTFYTSADPNNVCFKVSAGLYLAVSGKVLYLCNFTESGAKFGKATVFDKGSVVYATVIHNYLVVIPTNADKDLYLYNMNTQDLVISEAYSYDVSQLLNPSLYTAGKVSEDTIVVMHRATTAVGGSILVHLVKILPDGSYSIKQSEDLNVSSPSNLNPSKGTYYRTSATTSVTEDGIVHFVPCIWNEGSFNTEKSYLRYVSSITSMYDKALNSLVFNEESELISVDINSEVPVKPMQPMMLREPIKLSNGMYVCLLGYAMGNSSSDATMSKRIGFKLYIFRMHDNVISGLSERVYVKKYVSRISGVAKTAGANGSIIEVYAPASLL